MNPIHIPWGQDGGTGLSLCDANSSIGGMPFTTLYIIERQADLEVLHAIVDNPKLMAKEKICGFLFLNHNFSMRGCKRARILVDTYKFDIPIELSLAHKTKIIPWARSRRRMKKARSLPKRKSIRAEKLQNWEHSNEHTARTPLPNVDNSNRLRIRGGCLGLFKKKKPLDDEEVVPALVWWFAGGRSANDGSRPTGQQLREWKRRSKGDWGEGHQRGFFKECVFVMSRGKLCRHQRRRKQPEQPPEPETRTGAGTGC
ncbi:predicted protein [Uncinocarpus reesii 1704]|uniref:Uncharacterized protein n=1 Tax=Uncinocarpus reesii (strain UAMH 1704) TaxID=336963 RepID=C4JUW8_UNCRE|nr:uncharacterized protein UREG_04921 [Uncinocarpus reesii 1704]EEP80079.1 predicted protein [Uncinocarpus reesii 1704]